MKAHSNQGKYDGFTQEGLTFTPVGDKKLLVRMEITGGENLLLMVGELKL